MSKVRVAVLGSKNVGKTVVIHRLMYKEREFKTWLGNYQSSPTKGEEYVGENFHFVEIGGLGSLKARKRCAYYREADLDCFLVVFSIDEKSSVDNVVKRLVPEIKENILFNCPIILLLNKSDLIPSDIVGKVDKKIRSFVQDQELHMYLKLSNKTGEGYKQLFKAVKSLQGKGRTIPLIKTKKYVEKEESLKRRKTHCLKKIEGNELVYYSFHGDLGKVKELVEDGANTNMTTQLGQDTVNPFSASVMNNNPEIIRYLMTHPEVQLNSFNIEGETSLTYACKNKYLEVLDVLLRSQRIKIDQKNKMFYSIVEVMAQTNDEEVKAVWDKVKARESLFFQGIERKDVGQIITALYDPNIIVREESRELEPDPEPESEPAPAGNEAPGKISMDLDMTPAPGKISMDEEDEYADAPPPAEFGDEEAGKIDMGGRGNVISMDDDIMPPTTGEEEGGEAKPAEGGTPKVEVAKPSPEIETKVEKPKEKRIVTVLVVDHIPLEERSPISKVPLINLDCKNDNGESALEVALKTDDDKTIDYLFSLNGDGSRIRVEKDMAKLCQRKKDVILKKKTAQTIQSVFVEILKGERRYFEKMTFVNWFYLLPLRKNLKKLLKKGKTRKELILYCDLIFEIKKTSGQFLKNLASLYQEHYGNIRNGVIIENQELELQYKVVDLMRSLNYSSYLKYFEEDVLLSVDIKEEEQFAELYKFLLQCHKNIPLPREKANGFFVYTLNIKDRIMGYQNLLQRVLKTSDSESDLHNQVDECLTFIKKSIREFDDKVKNEKNMRRVETCLKTRYEMDSITQNKKRKYVHHQVDMEVVEVDGTLLSENTKKKKKRKKKKKKDGVLCYSMFMFSDLMVFATDDVLYIFFFHDTKSVFIFNSKNVHIKVYSATSKELLLELIMVGTSAKIEDMYRNMKDYYYLSCENYYIPKIALFSNLKLEEEVEEFLKYDKNNVIDIVMYKRDLLAQRKDMLEKEIEEIDREDEVFVEEIKMLRDRSLNKNQLKVEAHKMMQKYSPEKNVKNSPLVFRF